MRILETIELTQTNLKWQKIKQVAESRLEFRTNSFRYRFAFTADEPKDEVDREDEILLQQPESWHEVYTHIDVAVGKEDISCIELGYLQDNDVWKLSIFMNNASGAVKLFFETEERANQIRDKFEEFRFGKLENE